MVFSFSPSAEASPAVPAARSKKLPRPPPAEASAAAPAAPAAPGGAQAGLTAKAGMTATGPSLILTPRRAPRVLVLSFDTRTLGQCQWWNGAAGRLRDTCWPPGRDLSVKQRDCKFSPDLAKEAVCEATHDMRTPDMEKAAVYLVRCTGLHDPGHNTGHIGTHPDTMAASMEQRAMTADVVPDVRHALGRLDRSKVIAVYCNSAGEHRSVAVAEMVFRLCVRLGFDATKRDLCDKLWHRRGCG